MIKIEFLKEEHKAVIYDENNKLGECDFIESENTWNIIHTSVDSRYQGQGLARKLVECIIENSKKYNKNLIADCSYAKKVLENNK